MGSTKSTIVTLRVPNRYLARIEEEVKHSKAVRVKATPYNRNSWINQAIFEKLEHLDRGRRRRRACKPQPAALIASDPVVGTDTLWRGRDGDQGDEE